MNETERRSGAENPGTGAGPWPFFAVTFAITWGCWLSVVALDVTAESAVGLVLLLVGLAGPGIAGIAFVYRVYGPAGRADFWDRLTNVRRFGARWLLVILLVPLGVALAAGLIDLLLGGVGPTWGEGVQAFGVDPLALIPVLFFATLPPLLEELGWRGYALDRLQLTWSALNASLILGVVWAIWHLPLFLVEGTYQHDAVGLLTMEFWLFMAGIVALSPAFTWIYNNTERTILGVILLHGWVNFTAEVIAVPETIYYPLWFGLAAVIVARWGATTMTNDDRVPHPPRPDST